ncbi:MAG: DNA primase [Eubacteriales bacterium]|nr:DNA primase [Eubacteriales bacterium]
MTFIPQNIIDEVVARNDIVSVVSDYVQLEKRSGSNLFGLCPFHPEKTPSFSVSPGKNFFYCFGCHEGGNVIKFIQKIENLSFPEAVQFLAKRVGMEIELDESPEARQKQAEYKQMLACLLDAARFYYKSFKSPQGKAAERYLYQRRGLRSQVVTSFGLGYAPEEWSALNQELLSHSYPQELLVKLGLSRRSTQGNYYDFFRDRVMFPIFDHLGTLRAFGGRIMGEGEPKYLNSPDSAVYNKGRYLYALNFARKSRSDHYILCEGYMDTISMYEAGFTNCVAGLGTALTREQARLLSQYTDKVILAYDPDQAGRSAALKAIPHLEREQIECRVLVLPDGYDPDEYIHKYGKERFAALLERALPALDFRLYLAKEEASTAQGSLDVLLYQDLATNILAGEANAVIRELYTDKLARDLRISPASILQVIEQKRRGDKSQPTPTIINQPTQEKFRLNQATMIYLVALLDDNDLVCDPELKPDLEDFQPEVRPLMLQLLEEAENQHLTMPVLLNCLSEQAPKLRLEEALLPYLSRMRKSELRDPAIYARQALTQLKTQRLEAEKNLFLEQLNTTPSPEEQANLLRKLQENSQALNDLKQEV